MASVANAGTGLTFGEPIRGDGERARLDIRKLLPLNAKIRKSVNAAVTTSALIRPRRLKVV